VSLGWLRRPAREQPLLLTGLALACVVAIAAAVILTGSHGSHRQRVVSVTTPAAPPAVIGTKPPPPALSAVQLAHVRVTVRRFLTSYLPVLYGRRPARTIADADTRVRAELGAAARSPRAPRNRRPHVTTLTTHVQGTSTVVAIAMVADSVTKPYQIVFQLTDGHGGWKVTQLANY
jgi:hypothetical protein